MKTLKISNGEIRLGYELNDLSEKAKAKVISEQIDFLDSTIEPEEDEDEGMLNSSYQHSESDAIESIEINEYLFDEDGEMLPLLTYVGKDNQPIKTVFGANKYDVTFL